MQLLRESTSELDQATIDTVIAMFRRADDALKARDAERVMSLYSEQYNYHGLKKSDMRKIWKNLFDEFQELSNVHHLSRLAKVGSGKEREKGGLGLAGAHPKPPACPHAHGGYYKRGYWIEPLMFDAVP